MNELLWNPNKNFTKESEISRFTEFVNSRYQKDFSNYHELWSWSVENLEVFWESILSFFEVKYSGKYKKVLTKIEQPHINSWFNGIQVSYSEHVFSKSNPEDIAIIWENELGKEQKLTYQELEDQTSKLINYFKSINIKKHDVVVSYSPNLPQTIVGMLATNAIGAIWSSCSPDFGTDSVIDRFVQVEPKVLLYGAEYSYNNKNFNKLSEVEKIANALKTLEYSIQLTGNDSLSNIKSIHWEDILKLQTSKIEYTRVPFNHPMWVLYSSGTTGKPKAITHSVGGILIEHFKALGLHHNVKTRDRFFWYSTTGWMMWNYANSALLLGASVVIYEGSPVYPDIYRLWDFIAKYKVTHFGAGAALFINSMKSDLNLNKYNKFPYLSSIGSTGSPLTTDAFKWLYGEVKKDLWLVSLSGGTDICSGFVGGAPNLPVYEGEIQCRMLGVDLVTYNDEGKEVEDEVGELIVKQPMPSMPIYFWGDENHEKYLDAYYSDYKDVWRHGDWIKITKNKGVVIYGRSDSTLNRGGVRIGTSEIYTALNGIEFIKDAMVVCVDYEDGKQWMPLFVMLDDRQKISKEEVSIIKNTIKSMYSPRHIPDDIIPVNSIPYTISGKKMETPIKKLLMGKPLDKSLSKDAMKNPECIEEYLAFIK